MPRINKEPTHTAYGIAHEGTTTVPLDCGHGSIDIERKTAAFYLNRVPRAGTGYYVLVPIGTKPSLDQESQPQRPGQTPDEGDDERFF